MKIELIAFTDNGYALGSSLTDMLCDHGDTAQLTRGGSVVLGEWVTQVFAHSDALVFIGAAGIAVRAVAAHVVSKLHDPAVVVLDEKGAHCIPLLSGHVGGANDLARRIAGLTGAEAVITTATDLNDVFAVDSWAAASGMTIANPEKIKVIAARLLAGQTVRLCSDFPVAGILPRGIADADEQNCDIHITVRHTGSPDALRLIPPIAAVGIGCRKGTDVDTLEQVFISLLEQNSILPQAVKTAATIRIKQDEPGLLLFCQRHGLAIRIFTAEQLNEVKGSFGHSDFVCRTTGTGNVCQRSAAAASGGRCTDRVKQSGVTMALAFGDYTVRF